ncbi:hypothetical protein C5G87_18905 [Paenibacillus peoriae]|uniref:hypothetical protein n=1 Tax=Paenibacillus peoriae TaxID=59893 RepID=UPI000CEBC55D|nr:hypothetical protein [Paenibacillus peoriae]PPQ47381.1 hypothetical protein C5G87_18905 [Paenibacillus peoriae]
MMNKSINKYYLYYKNVLKDKYSTGEILTNIQGYFQPESVYTKKIGRHHYFDSIIIPEDGELLAIPLDSKEEILKRNNIKISTGERLFNNHQWVLPPFVPMGQIIELTQTPIGEKALELFEAMYPIEVIVRQIKGTYQRITEIKSHIQLITQAVESYLMNHVASSITLLLTVIEGIAREYCDNHSISYNKSGSTSAFEAVLKTGKIKWRDSILFYDHESKQRLILPDDYLNDTFLRRIDEGMDLLISYESYGLDYLYKSNSNHPLNRHSILHGTNKSFYIDINFYRLFTCLEALAFAVSLDPFSYNVEYLDDGIELLVRFEKLKTFQEFNKHIQ